MSSYDVIIVGAGPAGTSASIHLASNGFKVLLLEQKKFPREKLCGEFISPECADHFLRLGVEVEMRAADPAEINETTFYSRYGKRIAVPSRWFGGGAAMGLSRARMDQNLLLRARSVGVDVHDGVVVNNPVEGDGKVLGIRAKVDEVEREYRAHITIDATGRARSLARRVKSADTRHARKSKLVAFKAHLSDSRAEPGVCEIYSYKNGYGGLSTIEAGLSNLCFIVTASEVRQAQSDPQLVMRRSVMTNPRAAYTLESARICSDWLSVALESFGRHKPSPAPGLLAIGDSASFIDPFTGSGMLMALESGELVSQLIVRHRDKLNRDEFAELARDYAKAYAQKFDSRLRVSSLLRRVAFQPRLAQGAISICSFSDRFRGWLARSTRATNTRNSLSAPFS